MKEKGKERSQFYYTSPAANFASEGLDASQSIPIKPSIMEVRQGEQSIQQNVLLGFLAVVATLGVPFNTVAEILGMQTTYGPGQVNFGKLWSISGIVIGVVFGIGIIFMVTFRFKLYRLVKLG
jgi:Mg2+ and Co2+ transporter CorA